MTTTTLTRLRLDLRAVGSLFMNRTAGAGLFFGALLGLWGHHLTSGTFGSHLLLSVIGAFWGLVGAVVYVGFLQDLDLSSPAAVWFESEELPELELETAAAPPPARAATPATRRQAPAPAAAPPPAESEMQESAFDEELATG